MNLFKLGNFILSSGISSQFKIDCDALTDEDLTTLAKIIVDLTPAFGMVIGVPTGGLKLAQALQQYITASSDTILLVDDVLTTGESMNDLLEEVVEHTKTLSVIGVVIFARGKCPEWITPLFVLNTLMEQ